MCVFENFVSNYDSFIYVMQVYQNFVFHCFIRTLCMLIQYLKYTLHFVYSLLPVL